ncbi:IPT/TIG domain-containing protein [Streptomyces sp. NPDC020681]|uniref:lipase family protein n=1 Tax=Streptomyces sp. NPDC020681 TaxID=3365083 RepID=UPI0037B0EDBB
MTTSAQPTLAPAPVTMTLSAIAATAATPRPSGETLQQQALRAGSGITAQLKNTSLATGGTWQLQWLALSPDNANLVYIAWNSDGSNQIAVVVRGTVSSPIDMMEDLDVGTVVAFTAGGSADVAVSAGAMAAFTQVVNARGITGFPAEEFPAEQEPAAESGRPDTVVPSGTTLTQALAALLESVPSTPQPMVHVTGHSLGGCIATMLAPYLQAQAQAWTPNTPQFALFTFAAPTAGLQSFADYIDSTGQSWAANERHINAFDVVPLAWSDLLAAKKWYPVGTPTDPKGPPADETVKILLSEIDLLRKDNVYVQPQADSAIAKNGGYSLFEPNLTHKSTADFLGQIAFQHANSTYLSLLGAPPVPPGPVVIAVSPNAAQSGTQVAIIGSGFSTGCVVDFGPIPCTDYLVNLTGNWIAAVVPDGAGIVDVRVTNRLGTSPAVPLGRFAYDGPAPVAVSEVTPSKEKAGKQVTINGSGFVQGATVQFKDKAAHSVDVESPTRIKATVPHRLLDEPTTSEPPTVDVTVTVGVATSPTGPAAEFTYED